MNVSLNRKRQAGVGIVEIMVGMAISLFLLAGLVQIFASQKKGFLVQESQSRLQENARLASMILYSTIGRAGFHGDPTVLADTVFTTPVLQSTNGSGNAPDTITVRFQGADQNGDGIGDVTDCLGNPRSAGIRTNIFQIGVNSDGTPELQCDIVDGNPPRALIPNVENMQILYGEDTNGDNSVDRYLNTPVNVNNVRSVHVALLMASEDDIKPVANIDDYTLLDQTLTGYPTTGPDRIQRRVVERVIALRSLIP